MPDYPFNRQNYLQRRGPEALLLLLAALIIAC